MAHARQFTGQPPAGMRQQLKARFHWFEHGSMLAVVEGKRKRDNVP